MLQQLGAESRIVKIGIRIFAGGMSLEPQFIIRKINNACVFNSGMYNPKHIYPHLDISPTFQP
jgi:hypothetical protein